MVEHRDIPNPDTFFQARETANPYYAATPGIVQDAMDKLATLCGRSYQLFRYDGHPEAERVIISMGSGAEVARETALWMTARGEKVGALQVLLYRPFSAEHFLAALPATVKSIAVLDRCKESGGIGEPLYQDVIATLVAAVGEGDRAAMPRMIGGRYGLSSKEFHPGMVKAVFEEIAKAKPKNGFTIGINDDVSGTSLDFDRDFDIEPEGTTRAVFYGLGADGTVGANKNSVKILAEIPGHYAQGYFVYDSHKSGAETISHLRFGTSPIRAPYLIRHADFVACHKFDFLKRLDVLGTAREGATFLLNAPQGPDKVWDALPRPVQKRILDRKLRFFVIDATKVAQELGLGPRVNTILQTCFFAISGVLPRDEAIDAIKHAIEKAYGRKGGSVVEKNFAAVDAALAHLHEVTVPRELTGAEVAAAGAGRRAGIRAQRHRHDDGRARRRNAGERDADRRQLPAGHRRPTRSAISPPRCRAGTPTSASSAANARFVCPHSVIRAKYYPEDALAEAPAGFPSAEVNARGFPGSRFTLQIHVEDCTGCGICVENCPALSPTEPGHRAIDMVDKQTLIETGEAPTSLSSRRCRCPTAPGSISPMCAASQFLEPLFEFSGACAGCGETPYVKLDQPALRRPHADRQRHRLLVDLWRQPARPIPGQIDANGRGPAWSNSLFEDNAEFGLGYRLAVDQQTAMARPRFSRKLAPAGRRGSRPAILDARQVTESEFRGAACAHCAPRPRSSTATDDDAVNLLTLADYLVRRSVWIVGGDGWAYDIGYGGLDHVLAQDRDVNVLVLDTEVYSNTGGQASKATPLGASAKFAAAGKRVPRKDLAMQAIAYGYVYVAQIAMGANAEQTLVALREAEAYPGPSLVLAYSHCIAHGFDLRYGMKQQARATASGYWPLFRYDPSLRNSGANPFRLDSTRPRLKLEDFAYNELRYSVLTQGDREAAAQMMRQAQAAVDERYRTYEDLAARDGSRFLPNWESA